MDASRFQFSMTVPREPQFLPTVRRLAVQAARYALCREADAEAFGGAVEEALRTSLRDQPAGTTISIVMHRDAGPVEVLVDGHPVTVEP